MGRFNVVCAGRRFGKDVLAQDRAVYFALRHTSPVAWLAPSYRMLSDNFRLLSNSLAPVITRKLNNERLDLVGGGYIDFWSLEQPDRIRGRKYKHVIINEAAMVADLVDAFNLVIAPTLVDLRGSADFYSTPKGLNGFYNFYTAAVDNKSWERFKYTSYDNPTIPRDEIDIMVSMLPERVVKQEIMAEFVEDGAYFQRITERATIPAPDAPGDHGGHSLVAGLDWALSEDFTVLTIACRECNRVVYWDRFNQIDYTYQRERIKAALSAWGVRGILPERNSIGEPNIELLAQEGWQIYRGVDGKMGFNTTATTKPLLIQSLAAAFEHHGFMVPADYADELRSYQVESMASGRLTFGAPSGMHDDRVISLALAWWAMTNTSGDGGIHL
jgi:hypothetical protein